MNLPTVAIVFKLALVQLHSEIWCLEIQRDHLTASVPEDLKQNMLSSSTQHFTLWTRMTLDISKLEPGFPLFYWTWTHEKFSRTCSSSRMFKYKQKPALLRYSECSPLQKNSARSKMWTLAVQNSDELTVCSEKNTHSQTKIRYRQNLYLWHEITGIHSTSFWVDSTHLSFVVAENIAK